LVPSTAIATFVLAASVSAAPVVVIEHAQPRAHAVTLEAHMASTAGRKVIEPAAFVRLAGEKDFQRLAMQGLTGDTFSAELPASLADRDLEYFLEAFDEDGNGPFRKGSPERPLRLSPGKAAEHVRAPATAVEKSAPGTRRRAGMVLVASGAVIVVAGAVSGLLALNDYGIEKSTTEVTVYQSSKSAAVTESMVADALYGVGAAAVVVGAILWITDRPAADPPRVTVGAAPTRGGACAVLSGHF
jgi:hypothetical protein